MNGVSVKSEDVIMMMIAMMMIMTMIGMMMMMAVVVAIIRTKDVVGMIRIVGGLAVGNVVVIVDLLKKKIRLMRTRLLL